MRIAWSALIVLGMSMPGTAMAAWHIYCRNDRIVLETRPLSQMKSGRNDSTLCSIGPTFDFGPDAKTWVDANLRKKEGDSCSCR